MGKRYYCDFCDKSFADNATNRKNHMKGVTHRQLKREHYDYFKDATTKLREDFGKKPCRKFLNEGACNFGPLCMYSHISPEERRKLEIQAQKETESKKKGKTQLVGRVSSDEEIQEFVKACEEKIKSETSGNPQEGRQFPRYELADCLKGKVNLPPSLLPPSQEDLQALQTDGWG